MLDAIILAGGLGTRLREAVPLLPKPLAPINGIAFLDLLLEQIEQSGIIKKVVLALGYKAEAVIEHCSKQSLLLPIEFSIEETPLGTGGAVVRALEKTDSSPVFVFNGDSYFSFCLKEMARKYLSPAMIAYTHVEDASPYGRLEMDSTSRILAFREKQSAIEPGFINAGVYLFDRKIFESALPRTFSLEKELFPLLVPNGVLGYYSSGLFIDIGTKQTFKQAQKLLQPLTSE